MKDGIREIKDFIDKTITDETGDVGLNSELIKSLRLRYFLDIDDEAINNVARAKKEIDRTLREEINQIKPVDYPREYSMSEYINVCRDRELEDYGSAVIYLSDIYPFISEKERKFLSLLSSSEMCNFLESKLDDYGEDVDRDFSEAKLEVYYDHSNHNYDQDKYNKDIVENHKIIYKEKSYQKKSLENLFSTFFNQESLFDKRKMNEDIIKKCIDNVIESKNQETALLNSVQQYHLFRTDRTIYDVSFESEEVSSTKRPKMK